MTLQTYLCGSDYGGRCVSPQKWLFIVWALFMTGFAGEASLPALLLVALASAVVIFIPWVYRRCWIMRTPDGAVIP